MGGHGGLNILPQKRWNVYRDDNREKVRKDEEAAAKEEQLKREQSRRRDTEFRIEKLRQARGLSKTTTTSSSTSSQVEEIVQSVVAPASEPETKTDSKHINLFEGIRIFDPITEVKKEGGKEMNKKLKKKEEAPRVMTAEDEKYRLGYGVAGKGVKLPWYMSKLKSDDDDAGDEREKDSSDDEDQYHRSKRSKGNDNGKKMKKSLEELREERLKRERIEKEREAALLRNKSRRVGGGAFSWQR